MKNMGKRERLRSPPSVGRAGWKRGCKGPQPQMTFLGALPSPRFCHVPSTVCVHPRQLLTPLQAQPCVLGHARRPCCCPTPPPPPCLHAHALFAFVSALRVLPVCSNLRRWPPSNRRRLPSNRRRSPGNRRLLPSNRRRLSSNRRRLPDNGRRLPSNRRRSHAIRRQHNTRGSHMRAPTCPFPLLLFACPSVLLAGGSPSFFSRPAWRGIRSRSPPARTAAPWTPG